MVPEIIIAAVISTVPRALLSMGHLRHWSAPRIFCGGVALHGLKKVNNQKNLIIQAIQPVFRRNEK
jgi:hypothetical protein